MILNAMKTNAPLNTAHKANEENMKKTIHLDFLANVPLNANANALFEDTYPNVNTLDSTILHTLKADSQSLASFFSKTHSHTFDYSSGNFLALFSTLFAHHYHIVLAPSLHQQSFYAAELFKHISPQGLSFLPLNQQGILASPQDSHNTPYAFFIPLINQDILSLNPIQSLIEQILPSYPHALIFLDISLFVSTLEQAQLAFLRTLQNPQIIFLCNGESIGLMRPSGFIVSDFDTLNPMHKEALEAFFNATLLRPHLFKAASYALKCILSSPPIQDSKHIFFDKLQAHLGKDISLFAPLEITTKNALPLRFKHIKARLLIQALSIEGIYAINGQDCLFGNAKPSFVLRSMGYDEPSTRELLSVSYMYLDSIESITHILAQAYTQLRQFHT